MVHRINGHVKHERSGKGVSGLHVRVFPDGWIDKEDSLGADITDRKGEFSITLDNNVLKDGHIRPEVGFDVYIRITKPNGWLVHESRRTLQTDQDLKIEINASPSNLGGEHVISGTVYDAHSGNTLANLCVEAWDDDLVLSDFIGSAATDKFGHYRVSFEKDEFVGILDRNPDVYIKVKNQKGTILYKSSTRKEVRNNTIIDARIGGIELVGRVSDSLYQWKTFYNQEGSHVSVRIRLVPDDNIKDSELVLLREKWKKGIEEIWSDRYACCHESDAKVLSDCSRPARLTFEVQWVDRNPHYTVQVRKGPAVSNMLLWDTEDSEAVVAHLFGHMLGLEDEYYDPCSPSRVPVATGTLMDDGVSVVSRQVNHLCQFVNQNAVVIPHRGISDEFIAERPQTKTPSKQTLNEEIARLLKAINAGETLLEKGDKIVHRVSGGALSDRYEWSVEILHDGRATHIVRDELKGIDAVHTISLDSQSMSRLVKKIIASGINKTRPVEHGYLPDSLVGCFTLDISGRQRSWSFLASPIQRRTQRCRMGKAIAAVNRLMLRVAALTRAGGLENAKMD